jgi:hypothetical protein
MEINELELRILALEAKVYSLEAQNYALGTVLLKYLESHQVHMGGIAASKYNQQVQVQRLDAMLGALADENPTRASMIRELLKSGKML